MILQKIYKYRHLGDIKDFKKIFENEDFELNILFIEKETPTNTLPFLE